MSKKNLLLLFLITIGFALRLHGLAQRSLWTDEFFTLFQSSGHGVDIQNLLQEFSQDESHEVWKAARYKAFLKNDPAKSIKEVSEAVVNTDTYPPLYFLLIHLWTNLCGDSASAVRFFSLLMGVCAIVLSYKVSLYLFDERTALFSALFVSVSGFAVRYSQEARAYSMLIALGLLSWLFLARFEKRATVKDGLLFALFNCLGIYTHYLFALVSIGFFLYFTLVYRHTTALLRRFYVFFLCSLLLVSLLVFSVMRGGYKYYLTEWLFGHPVDLASRLQALLAGLKDYFFFGQTTQLFYMMLSAIGIVVYGYTAWQALRDKLELPQKSFACCMILITVPLAILLCMDILLHGVALQQERYWVFSFLGVIPLSGYVLRYSFSRNKYAFSMLVACMLVFSLKAPFVQFGPAPQEAASWINSRAQAEPAAVIVYNARGVVFAQSYYLDKDIYMVAVASKEQFSKAIESLSGTVKRIFIARHYYKADPDLLNRPFLEQLDITPPFTLVREFNKDHIRVSEYLR